MNANQFLEHEIRDYVMLEITYISVLCSPDQKPDALSIPVSPHQRDAVIPVDTSLGRPGFHSPCHPNELWAVLIANSSRQSLLILLGTYEHSLHTLIHRIFPPSPALLSLNFDFKLFSSSSYKAGVSLFYTANTGPVCSVILSRRLFTIPAGSRAPQMLGPRLVVI